MMKLKKYIEEARLMAGDKAGDGQRWFDTDWLREYNSGCRFLYNHLPSSKLTTAGALSTFTDVNNNDLEAESVMDDVYFLPVVHWMAWRFFMSDSADNRDVARAGEQASIFFSMTGIQPAG